MFSGKLYNPENPEILKEQTQYQEILYDLNQLRPSQTEKQEDKQIDT